MSEPIFETKEITLDNGGKTTSYVQFNDGHSHMTADDNCWVIINVDVKLGSRSSAYIFEEAKQVLDKLPDKPSLYVPYREAVGMVF